MRWRCALSSPSRPWRGWPACSPPPPKRRRSRPWRGSTSPRWRSCSMSSDALPPLPREAEERVYRLSPAQAGMLFHDLASPGRSPYDRQVSYCLEGVIDPVCCEAAWNRLLARHAMLRSLFDHERAAEPLQIILRSQTVDFHYEDVE